MDDCALWRRLLVLPRVSKRWARILGQPSGAWQCADINLSLMHKLSDVPEGWSADWSPFDARVISAWFSRWTPFAAL